MKKVLIVGFIWGYHSSGSARVPGLVKYLPEFGWQPVILTAALPVKPNLGCEIVEVSYHLPLEFWMKVFGFKADEGIKSQLSTRLGVSSQKSIKKAALDFIMTRAKEGFYYPDAEKGWESGTVKAGNDLLQKHDISAIISSSTPFTAHLIAHRLKTKYHIPWIADLPHLWSQNNGYPYSSLRRMIDRRLELKALSQADVLTTTSEPLADKLRTLHKEKTVEVITHGFDPETVNDPPTKLTEKFTITYTGSFAPVFREPAMLFKALRNLIERGIMERARVEVRFFGTKETWIEGEIQKYGLGDVVNQYGKVPISVSQAKQRESQILYNPKWNDPAEPGIHSIKMLEYLAARRPILATGNYKDVADDLLEETGAGVSVSSVIDTERALKAFYAEYLEKGGVAFRGKESVINTYSQYGMANRFSHLLNSKQ